MVVVVVNDGHAAFAGRRCQVFQRPGSSGQGDAARDAQAAVPESNEATPDEEGEEPEAKEPAEPVEKQRGATESLGEAGSSHPSLAGPGAAPSPIVPYHKHMRIFEHFFTCNRSCRGPETCAQTAAVGGIGPEVPYYQAYAAGVLKALELLGKQ